MIFYSCVRAGPKVEQEELTVIARNQETNQIIGAMVTDDFCYRATGRIAAPWWQL